MSSSNSSESLVALSDALGVLLWRSSELGKLSSEGDLSVLEGLLALVGLDGSLATTDNSLLLSEALTELDTYSAVGLVLLTLNQRGSDFGELLQLSLQSGISGNMLAGSLQASSLDGGFLGFHRTVNNGGKSNARNSKQSY